MEFNSRLGILLEKMAGTKHVRISALHPASNGQIERFNRELGSYLRLFEDEYIVRWRELLPAIQGSYNSSVHHAALFAPYLLQTGRNIKWPFVPLVNPPEFTAKNEKSFVRAIMQFMDKTNQVARTNIQAAEERMKKDYDQRHGVRNRSFSVGDQVLIFFPKSSLRGPNAKLRQRWCGPFFIEEVLEGGHRFRVRREGAKSPQKNHVHIDRLKPFLPSDLFSPSYCDPSVLAPEASMDDRCEVEPFLPAGTERGVNGEGVDDDGNDIAIDTGDREEDTWDRSRETHESGRGPGLEQRGSDREVGVQLGGEQEDNSNRNEQKGKGNQTRGQKTTTRKSWYNVSSTKATEEPANSRQESTKRKSDRRA